MDSVFALARGFMQSQARLLERLLFAVQFERGEPRRVGSLIASCQNEDGGLGHALEPDLRCPQSQPLFVEVGLLALHDAGWRDRKLALSVCSFLEAHCDPGGLVPTIFSSALESPHAGHWSSAGSPDLNPTAGICGLLHYQGVRHPWLTRATHTCCERLLSDTPPEAHTLLCAARLVDHLPDQRMADELMDRIASALPKASFFIEKAPVRTYGLTPLHFAPSPASRWHRLFSESQIEGHLQDLMARQQADGGWPVTWEPPGPASACEWRGRLTLEAVRILAAYELVKTPDSGLEPGGSRAW